MNDLVDASAQPPVIISDVQKLSVPIAAAGEMTQLVLFVKGQIVRMIKQHQKAFREASNDPNADPPAPQSVLPWVRELRQTLRDIGDLMAMTPPEAQSGVNVQLISDMYDTLRADLSPAARAEMARLEQKARSLEEKKNEHKPT